MQTDVKVSVYEGGGGDFGCNGRMLEDYKECCKGIGYNFEKYMESLDGIFFLSLSLINIRVYLLPLLFAQTC